MVSEKKDRQNWTFGKEIAGSMVKVNKFNTINYDWITIKTKGEESMGYELAMKFAKMAYRQIIRPLVCDAVADSKTKIDDIALDLLDKIFDYKEGE